jgi:hypothetical protein
MNEHRTASEKSQTVTPPNVRDGSKSEELSLSKCLPGYRLKADIARYSWHVANVPQAAMPNHVMEQTFRPAGTMSFGDEQPTGCGFAGGRAALKQAWQRWLAVGGAPQVMRESCLA